jgi:hypothetical protein
MSAEKNMNMVCEEEENKYISIEEQFGLCMRKDMCM